MSLLIWDYFAEKLTIAPAYKKLKALKSSSIKIVSDKTNKKAYIVNIALTYVSYKKKNNSQTYYVNYTFILITIRHSTILKVDRSDDDDQSSAASQHTNGFFFL